MTVVAIIGIAVALAMPYFHFTPESRVKAAANDIAGILSNARMTAVANNATEVVKFNDAADTCYFNPANTSTSCEWSGKINIFFPAAGSVGSQYATPSFDVQGSERWVQFNSRGVPSGFHNVEEAVYLQYRNDPSSKIYKVTVGQFTGMVTITYWDGVSKWVSLY